MRVLGLVRSRCRTAARHNAGSCASLDSQLEHAVCEQTAQVQPNNTIELRVRLCKLIDRAAVHVTIRQRHGIHPSARALAGELFYLDQGDCDVWTQLCKEESKMTMPGSKLHAPVATVQHTSRVRSDAENLLSLTQGATSIEVPCCRV